MINLHRREVYIKLSAQCLIRVLGFLSFWFFGGTTQMSIRLIGFLVFWVIG